LITAGNDIAVSKPQNDEVGSVVTNANLYFGTSISYLARFLGAAADCKKKRIISLLYLFICSHFVITIFINYYIGTWLAFATCIYLSGSLAQDSTGVDVTQTPPKTARWYGLTASSLVVLGSSVRVFLTSDCGDEIPNSATEEYCRRSKFAISMGVFGFFLAAAMTCLTRKGLTLVAETAATTVQMILWCFGVGYITFGTSPGSTIGNLFFGTWISFVLTIFLFGQCFREYVAGRENAAAQQNGDNDDDCGHEEEQAYDDAI